MQRHVTIGLLLSSALTMGTAAAAGFDSPKSVTTGLYTWVFARNSTPSGKDRFLTPRFAADLAAADAYEKRMHKIILDANPYIDAQIEADAYTVGTPMVTGATARVPVKIAYKKYPTGNTVTIVAKKTAGGWLIDDILSHTGTSTDALIRRNLAMAKRYEAKHPKR